MATTDFIAAIELSSSKISGIAGKKNSDGSIQVLALAYAREMRPRLSTRGHLQRDKTSTRRWLHHQQAGRTICSSIAKSVGIKPDSQHC